MMLRLLLGSVAVVVTTLTLPATAGEFDAQGNYLPSPDVVAGFEFGADFDPVADVLDQDDEGVCDPAITQLESADALDGAHHLHIETSYDASTGFDAACAARLLFQLPAGEGSYRASLWMRHGTADVQINVDYDEDSGLDDTRVKLAPTGRVTSDGWVELMSNDFPVAGDQTEAVYLRVIDYDDVGTDIDTLELVRSGQYRAVVPCAGAGDPVCGAEAVCVYRQCRLARTLVPPLPAESIIDDMVDSMQGQLRVFYGGRKTRLTDLPNALAQLDAIRYASDAWTFWNGWANAFRLLHDWHTRASGPISGFGRDKRLSACFIQGRADVSQAQWPSHAFYPDVLVSHHGNNGNWGVTQGDRLVAVDGMHPIEWALTLRDIDWGWWQANTDGVYSEMLERMRGSITRYARQFTVLHCDSTGGSCDAVAETYLVDELPDDTGGQIRCDNRPFFHLGDANPPANHNINNFFWGPVVEATAQEAIYGLVWDTLYGGGDPNGWVNSNLQSAFVDFKNLARGVVLDHRAGNGGTVDGAETATFLIRPPEKILVLASPTPWGNWDGPESAAEGVSVFNQLSGVASMTAGSNDYDPDMPVALVLHRDGSASDFMPQAFKNVGPKVRIFGPARTAGAFSTYYELEYWGGLSFRFGSGDSITSSGEALIGNGVEPDEYVVQTQSDLLAGLDTIHEAALAWLRTELKP